MSVCNQSHTAERGMQEAVAEIASFARSGGALTPEGTHVRLLAAFGAFAT